MMLGEGTELERAKRMLEVLKVVGQVEAFDEAIQRLGYVLATAYPKFITSEVKANSSKGMGELQMSEELAKALKLANVDDLIILQLLRLLVPAVQAPRTKKTARGIGT